jgi:hypothetical protein
MPDKVNQEPRNEQGLPHGQWIIYWNDGTIFLMGYHINGVECGYSILQMRVKNSEPYYVKKYNAR